MIGIEAARDGQVIGVQLRRDDVDDRRQPGRGVHRHGQPLVDLARRRHVRGHEQAGAVVVLESDQQGRLGLQLRSARGDRQHRQAGFSERERPVLEVGRRVGHGRDQRQLLQLQGPFPCGRVAVATTEHDGALRSGMRSPGRARRARRSALRRIKAGSPARSAASSGDGGSIAATERGERAATTCRSWWRRSLVPVRRAGRRHSAASASGESERWSARR